MKKSKRVPVAEKPATKENPVRWWPWAAAAAALLVVFEAYGPSLNGDFVLDDLYLPFNYPHADQLTLWNWLTGARPVLMFSYWLNYKSSGTETFSYHATNVVLHFLVAVVIALVTAKLLEWTGVTGRSKAILSVFAAGLFLLHPVQTESVSYVASRSEDLSVLFYFGALALFLYRPEGRISVARSVAYAVLLLIAVSTKEHTLTLPVLALAASWFWGRGGIRQNPVFWGLQAAAGVVGALLVVRVLRAADSAGFHVKGVDPAAYFFSQCRVIWMYVRLFFLPAGQNADPDIPLSANLFDHGAVLGLLALIALAAAAWVYRKRYPLAAFGVFMFLLLIAPTSSFIPIQDVYAERRMYLPFLGLTLVCLEFLRRLDTKAMTWTAVIVLAWCSVLTYQRSQVWASPTALWNDTVAKSPHKVRPRFQLAFAYYAAGRCPEAAENYQIAASLGAPDYRLLLDWANALYCANRDDEAAVKLQQAVAFERPAEAYLLLGAIYGKRGQSQEALDALARAESIDPSIAEIYVNRGNVYMLRGDREAALNEYRRALNVDPTSQHALEALAHASSQ
ncbi:MAG TPA: tetratricopeptide repeat protein [Bryobacteraceae bacterium]|nr:tetratricopeptide repeat protein [Bryobacteraceae bacterium]